MEYVKNLVKDNYMLLVLVLLLFAIMMLGTWENERMDNIQVQENIENLY